MGDTTHQIESHIERTRDALGANLHELERKVGEITDWRHHFRNRPLPLLGLAFGGGALLATMLSQPRSASPSRVASLPADPYKQAGPYKHRAAETWDHIRDALLGVAAARVTNFVGDLVPGFTEEFRSASRPRV